MNYLSCSAFIVDVTLVCVSCIFLLFCTLHLIVVFFSKSCNNSNILKVCRMKLVDERLVGNKNCNVNKRIGVCQNLVLFCRSCKNDIYSFNASPQEEKEKKKEMMDINLKSVAAVTSLGGGITSLRNLCMHFDFPRSLHYVAIRTFN